MPQTDLDAPLWFESEMEDKPIGVYSREDLVEIETEALEWNDAEVRARLEVLLLPWGQARTVCSTAFARPLDADNLPWIALGSHRLDGPRLWQGGGAEYNDARPIARHLRRALPALLRRRLWGRALWLDRELNLADETSGVLRLYLGANGQGEWFLPETAAPRSLRAGFDWTDENCAALLLGSSDEALLHWVYAQAEIEDSDLAFSLNWVSWGVGSAAREQRASLQFRLSRDTLKEMLQVLGWASECEPEFAEFGQTYWQIDPLMVPTRAYGSPESWQVSAEKRRVGGRAHSEHLFIDGVLRRLPPFLRAIREWAHDWFGAELNHELRARHRCVAGANDSLVFRIERAQLLSAHEQLEAFAQLRDFLAQRVAPDELQTLLKLS